MRENRRSVLSFVILTFPPYRASTRFCVSKIFGPVGPEKTVICDRSALAERSCRGGHWPSEKLWFAEITGYVHAGRFRMTNGHPYREDMALHRRGRCPHRPAPGRLRAGKWICAKPNPPHLRCGRQAGKPVPYYPSVGVADSSPGKGSQWPSGA